MMIKDKILELQKLSTAHKFALAVELWDEFSSNPDEIPVTEEQLNELDRRFEEYRQHPDKVVTWEEAKARILSLDRRTLRFFTFRIRFQFLFWNASWTRAAVAVISETVHKGQAMACQPLQKTGKWGKD